jgi:signal transduction histidine kinase
MRHYRRCALVLVAAVLALLASIDLRADRSIKQVLIIHGGPESFPGNDTFDAALREVLFAHPTIQVAAHSEYFENEEFGVAADPSLLASLRIKLEGRRPDVVIANAAPALEFALRHRHELFPDAPVVFISAAEPAGLVEGTLRGVTGVLRYPSQVETVDLALRLHPRTTRLHVVAYAPAVDGFEARVRAALTSFSSRLQLTFANERTLPEMLAVIKALPADSLVLWVRYSPVTTGRVIFPHEFLPQIAAAAPVPIYGALYAALGQGVVGGMMRDSVADSRALGEMTLGILEGRAPESIPLARAAARPAFDWRALQRWGIDESRLPAGADIRYRVPGVWQLYGGYIVATFIVVAAQLVLIGGLLRERKRVRRADQVIRASEASLRWSYERIRRMAGLLINAQEAARAEIARDLHDDVCQRLAGVAIAVSSLKRATRDVIGPNTLQAFERLDRDTKWALDGIRRLSHELHPAMLLALGLDSAVRGHCAEVAERCEVEVTLLPGAPVGDVHPDSAVCLFRILQESLRNGIVHGEARRLTVSLSRHANQLTLEVTDDGCGFDIGAMLANRKGLGLVTIEERASLLGGHAEIVSSVGAGTTVRAVVPADQPGIWTEPGLVS